MQIYDFTVAVNGQRQLDAPGNYFYYYSGSAAGADQTITLRGVSSGLRIVLKNGQSLRLPKGHPPETSWYIGNYANAATIVGTVIVGNGEIQDNRIQGDVSIIDSNKSKTIAGLAMGAFVYQGAVAAQYSRVQLLNTSTTKRLVVEELTIISGAAAIAGHIRQGIASLVTLGEQGSGKDGVSASIAQARSDTTAAASVASAGVLLAVGLAASGTLLHQPKTPYVVPPLGSLTLYGTIANVDIGASFGYTEELL